MDRATLVWWTFLLAAGVLNFCAWGITVWRLRKRHAHLAPATWSAVRIQAMLSAGYVAGCAYRSAFPVFDVPRQVMVDGWWSSVLVGRSVATIAELCFAAQWALLLRALSRQSGSDGGLMVARLIVPSIVVAELCSWYAVLTTSNLGHVLEESIWGACAALLVFSLLALWRRVLPPLRPMVLAVCALGVAYVAYMFLVDVPMYWQRWIEASTQQHPVLGIWQGIEDTASRWVVSHRWSDWQSEVVWMSVYFSVAVWASIALIHVMPVLVSHRGLMTLATVRSRQGLPLRPVRTVRAASAGTHR